MAKKNDDTKGIAITLAIILWIIYFVIYGVIIIISSIIKLFTKLINKQNKQTEQTKKVKPSPKPTKKKNHTGLIFGIAIASLLEASGNKVDKNLERKMAAQNLEDWQKDLVREGKYSPYSFEEEELEEDDYYFEDD